MTAPRRQIVRPARPPAARPPADRQAQKVRSKLETERAALPRWMTRLERAFHAAERAQRRIARLERTLARLVG
jgi:hypothetical protein